MKLFDYLFYKVYKLINYFGNTDFYPELNSWFITAMLVWLNFLTVLYVAELRLERSLTGSTFIIPFYMLYLILSYKFLIGKARYKTIIETYDTKVSNNKYWGSMAVAIYVIATLIFHFYFSEQRKTMALQG